MEQEQRAIIDRPSSVDKKSLALTKTTTVVAHEPKSSEVKGGASNIGKAIIEAEWEEINHEANESYYYTLEEHE